MDVLLVSSNSKRWMSVPDASVWGDTISIPRVHRVTAKATSSGPIYSEDRFVYKGGKTFEGNKIFCIEPYEVGEIYCSTLIDEAHLRKLDAAAKAFTEKIDSKNRKKCLRCAYDTVHVFTILQEWQGEQLLKPWELGPHHTLGLNKRAARLLISTRWKDVKHPALVARERSQQQKPINIAVGNTHIVVNITS
jgi:hypothetical protein